MVLMKTIYIESLGCAKNLVDSEIMLGILHNNGYVFTENPEIADIIIINTCGFIADAVEESFERIKTLSFLKKNGKCQRLIVCGCLVERFKEKLQKELPETDIFLGAGEYPHIAKHLKKDKTKRTVNNLYVNRPAFLSKSPTPRIISTPPGNAYLKISEGCSHRCTFCTIPLIKGSFKHRSIPSILSEAKALSCCGVKELNLVGQDTTAFKELPKLLKKLEHIEAIKWIRLLYCHPKNLSDEIIHAIAASEKICSYIDIPIQHISDNILKKMGRRTTRKQIENILNKIKTACPEAAIRTTIITGFPGETEKDFEELVMYVKETEFESMGVFIYSDEGETPASKMKKKIPYKEKLERYKMLMSLQKKISAKKNRQRVGNIIEALVEGPSPDKKYKSAARAEYHAPEVDGLVLLDRDLPAGTFVKTKITKSFAYDLAGEVV